MTLIAPSIGALMYSRVGVVPGDDGVEALVEVDARLDGVQADAVTELAQPRERVLALGEARL